MLLPAGQSMARARSSRPTIGGRMTTCPTTPIPGFHDPFSSLTHLAGAAVFAALAVPLLALSAVSQSRADKALAADLPALGQQATGRLVHALIAVTP